MSALELELSTALDLADRCGALALRIQAGGAASMQTTDKPDDGGPVTRADLAVEAAIVETLRDRFPADAVLAEEQAQDDSWREHERVWIIDPIDGTRDFAAGQASWAIHIGLAIAGRPVLGVVHEPGGERTSWAVNHEGDRMAWTRRAHGSAEALHGIGRHAARWRMVASKSHSSPRLEPIAAALDIEAASVLRTSSVGVKIAMVARGEAEIYAHPTAGTKLWDSCAPEVLITAAGGRMTDLLGRPLCYDGDRYGNETGLLASTAGQDHAALVAQLAELGRGWFPEA